MIIIITITILIIIIIIIIIIINSHIIFSHYNLFVFLLE